MSRSFDPSKDMPDMKNRVIVITGGTAGLGAETVRNVAACNPRCIYICARTLSKAEALISQIQGHHPQTGFTPVLLEQSSLKSVIAAGETILKSTDRLDLLFLNGGIAGTAPALTEDGYESQFGVNHIAHAMLTQLLVPIMLQTANQNQKSDVRIIATASDAANIFPPKSGIALNDVKTDMASYGGMTRYGQSKLANILFIKKVAQLYPSITSVAIHPGLVRTDNVSKADGAGLFKLIWRSLLWVGGVNVEEGVKCQLWASTAKDVRSGEFYLPVGKIGDNRKFTNDQELTNSLWTWTERELDIHGGPGWPRVS